MNGPTKTCAGGFPTNLSVDHAGPEHPLNRFRNTKAGPDPLPEPEPTLRFFVPGRPRPKGSLAIGKRKGGGLFLRRSTAQGDEGAWSESTARAAMVAMRRAEASLFEGGITAILTFLRLRPKGHLGKDGTVKPRCARLLPAGPPDADKLIRSVGDALQGVVFRNDAQLTTLLVQKRWAKTEGVMISLWRDNSDPDIVVPADD